MDVTRSATKSTSAAGAKPHLIARDQLAVVTQLRDPVLPRRRQGPRPSRTTHPLRDRPCPPAACLRQLKGGPLRRTSSLDSGEITILVSEFEILEGQKSAIDWRPLSMLESLCGNGGVVSAIAGTSSVLRRPTGGLSLHNVRCLMRRLDRIDGSPNPHRIRNVATH